MMKLLKLARTLCISASLSVAMAGSVLAADFSKLIILHTNDTHGFDKHENGSNGMAVISQVKKDLKKQGYDVLLLDAGDAIQDNNLVNFSKGKSAIAFMNAAGYNAATLGNHEFDYGQDVLAQRIKEAEYPYVSATVFVEATGKTLVPPSVLLDRKSGKIGIVGMTTPETQVSTTPKNVYGLRFVEKKELYKTVQKEVDSLKAQGAELIIALGHMGSEDGCMGNRSDDVLANVKGIDIFIDGHDHKVKNKTINGALLVETGHYTKNIGKITYKNGKWVGELIPFGAYKTEDKAVADLIAKADREVKASLGQKLGTSSVTLSGARDPGVRTQEMPLGDFCADAYLWQARQANVLKGPVDIAICNGGGLRETIKAGTITRGDLVGVNPYNNQMYVAKITGRKLLEVLEAATSSLPDAMGAFPQVAGMTYTVNTKVKYQPGKKYPNSVFYAPAKPGSRVTINSIGGKPFDPDAVYTVSTIEFIAVWGGDNYGGLTGRDAKIDIQSIGYVDEETFENYLVTELKGKIDERYAKSQNRITIIK